MANSENQSTMLVYKVQNVAQNLATRKYTDGEILEDLEVIRKSLEEKFW